MWILSPTCTLKFTFTTLLVWRKSCFGKPSQLAPTHPGNDVSGVGVFVNKIPKLGRINIPCVTESGGHVL
ncbi:hypothetical protein L596_018335 [Steinernema carpocapsae]|uniref:Secreted protein n=1 Tax=Steinernema carpocapsae TaxID=34508 RepID=A0A4U5N4P2_STECR|nr:hypothetical protein L596_018335 [Steinernema carpocapsae]